jgi:adenosylmethionine-8-amino-7-oxononanoate aminotransferase
MPPLPIARGQGPWLIDFDGKRYLDGTSSWWVNLFGHANPHINAALKTQLDSLEHVMLAGATHRPAVELAERLIDLTGGVLGHSFFGSDGASAVEIALKMSFHAHRNAGQGARSRFVCLEHGYHGETLGALGVTDVAIFRDAYDPLILQSHRVPSPDARLAAPGETAADVAERALAALRDCLTANAGTIAAVIIEPLVQCAAGMAMHDVSYLRGVRALCDEFGVHWGADAPAPSSPASRPASGRICCACPRASAAGICHCRSCSRATPSTTPSMTMRRYAASCIRTRTRAIRWPAARRSQRWTCLPRKTSSRATA